MPATRSASGPMPAPRTLAPTSVGAPIRLTVFIAAHCVARSAGPGRLLQDASPTTKAGFEFAEWFSGFNQGVPRMLAMQYRGPYRVRATQKAEPRIELPNDAIVRVMRTCICGSDLHLYHGLVPDTRVGHTFGHEFVGVIEEVGPSVQSLKKGDQVIVPFTIFCGTCNFCQKELYSNCHNVNPEATAIGGIYGYSHSTGGYAGGQAEFVRVPLADIGPMKLPE